MKILLDHWEWTDTGLDIVWYTNETTYNATLNAYQFMNWYAEMMGYQLDKTRNLWEAHTVRYCPLHGDREERVYIQSPMSLTDQVMECDVKAYINQLDYTRLRLLSEKDIQQNPTTSNRNPLKKAL